MEPLQNRFDSLKRLIETHFLGDVRQEVFGVFERGGGVGEHLDARGTGRVHVERDERAAVMRRQIDACGRDFHTDDECFLLRRQMFPQSPRSGIFNQQDARFLLQRLP